MAKILLGVTGSVAAIKTPQLYGKLKTAGHRVKVVASRASCYFFDPNSLDPLANPVRRNPDVVILDEDEWPGDRYQRGDPVLHIELRRWADVLVIAPLDANTLAKLAGGLADSCLTCIWRAWEPARPVILAPAMNTLMWNHPATGRHLRQLAEDASQPALSPGVRGESLLTIVPPQEKRLACDDVGMGAMADLDPIVAAVEAALDSSAGRARLPG